MESGASAPLLTKNPYPPSRPRSRNNTLQNRRRPFSAHLRVSAL